MSCYSCGSEDGDDVRLCPACAHKKIEEVERAYQLAYPKSKSSFVLPPWLVPLSAAVLILIALAFDIRDLGYSSISGSSFRLPPGILIPNSPRISYDTGKESWIFKGFKIVPQAEIKMEGRVLTKGVFKSKSPFSRGWGELSPVDLTVGWGVMSDTNVLSKMNFAHGYRKGGINGVSERSIEVLDALKQGTYSFDNLHLIPSTDEVEASIKKARVEDLIHIEGYLVNVYTPDGGRWEGSLKTGEQCFVIWVDRLDELPVPVGK